MGCRVSHDPPIKSQNLCISYIDMSILTIQATKNILSPIANLFQSLVYTFFYIDGACKISKNSLLP